MTKKLDSSELDFRAFIEFLRTADLSELDPVDGSAPQKRLLQLMTSCGRPMATYDFGKLKKEFVYLLKHLFAEDKQFNQAERVENFLALTHAKSQSRDRYDDVSPAQENTHPAVPYRTIMIKRRRYVIKTVNFDDPSNLLYRVLDNAVRNDLLQKLKTCPTCKNWFALRTKRTNFCSTACAPSSSKLAQRERARLSRRNKIKVAEETKLLSAFRDFLAKAYGKNRDEVNPVVKRLGGGDGIRGWKLMDQWRHNPEKALAGFDPTFRKHLSKLLLAAC